MIPPMDPAFASLIKQPREVLRDAGSVRAAILAARKEGSLRPADAELDLREFDVPRPADDPGHMPIRIYRRSNTLGPLPVLLYFHGGGFFCGDLASDQPQCIRYALEAGCAVVSVAYRLAPEEPFPAALTDCYAVLEFISRQCHTLDLNPDFIAVGGSSAGANLAAAVALLARDRKGPKICFQMLLVPVLDDRLETTSARVFTDVPDFARPEAEVMWQWYLGKDSGDVSPYAAPARAIDLSGLPTAYILCAGLDPLRDEGLEYALRLTEAGVTVELHLVPSIPHGFASISSAAISVRLLNEQVEVLRAAFRRSHPQL